MTPARRIAPAEVPGLAARRIAADILDNVLRRHRPLDAELDGAKRIPASRRSPTATARWCASSPRPCCAASARCAICCGSSSTPAFPKDAPRVETALLIGAAQILFLDVPDHAAVDLSVRLVQADRRAAKYPGLINAVLRRVAREGPALLAELDPVPLDTPPWLFQRWQQNFGDDDRARDRDRARARAAARSHRQGRCRKLGAAAARARAAHRQRAHGRARPGLAAARLPRRRVVGAGRRRCACRRACSATSPASASRTCAPRPAARPRSSRKPAPQVTAVDRSANRLVRVRENLARLGLARRHDRDRRDRMAGRTVRCRAGRRALLLDRHDPPPSRRRLAEAGSRHRAAHRRCSAACSTAPPR